MQRIEPNPLNLLHEKYAEEQFHLLLPKVHVANLPAGTQIAIREVRVNEGDTYPVGGGKFGIGKASLEQIANAAGVDWVEERRSDDRGHPHYCEFVVSGKVTDFDGTVRNVKGSKTVDLRDDAGGGIKGKDLEDMKSGQVPGARKFITEQCCSKAKLRAIRSILGMPGSYTKEELRKPFIIPKLVPDTSDSMAREMVIAGMMGARQLLYAHGGRREQVIDAELIPTTETPIPPIGVSGEASGGGSGSPPDADPPMPGEPECNEHGDVMTAQEIQDRFAKAYRLVAGFGMPVSDWKAMLANIVGSTPRADLTAQHIAEIEYACDEFAGKQAGGA